MKTVYDFTVKDRKGKPVFTATAHELSQGVATMAFQTAADEHLYTAKETGRNKVVY